MLVILSSPGGTMQGKRVDVNDFSSELYSELCQGKRLLNGQSEKFQGCTQVHL